MGLEFLSMTLFWTWTALQPAPQAAPVPVMPTKVILQATWVEPASVRDETSPPASRQPASAVQRKMKSQTSPVSLRVQPQKRPLWKSAVSYELPPVLWAGFMGFLAAGLGIVSVLNKS